MTFEVGVSITGATFRVQRQKAGHTIRASFVTREEANAYSLAVTAAWAAGALPPSPDEFQQAYVNPRSERKLPANVPTRLDDLVELALVMHQRNKHLGADWLAKPRGQWGKQGRFFGNPDIRNLTRERVQEFSVHLYEQRLSKSTAREYLRLVDRACEMAMELKLVPANVASGVTGKVQDNPLRPHNRRRPRPITPAEAKALAAQFPGYLQLVVLLMYVACLRISEAFGIELRDWDPVAQTLHIRRQGGLKKNEDRRDPTFVDEADGFLKNKSSRRRIPVAPSLAEVIDRHIADHHGMRPDDPVLEWAWLNRRLISKPGRPKPRNTVVVDRWQRALEKTGLDFDTLGFHVDRHFLRKSGSTVIGVGDIRGKLWSGYLGHRTPAEFGGSLTTVQHYFDLPDEELVVVAERWEQVIRDSVGDLLIAEEWWSTPHMTIAEAACVLGVTPSQVTYLLGRGRLSEAAVEDVDSWRHLAGTNSHMNRRIISGASIQAELERRARRGATLTQVEAADELGLPVWYVKALEKRGVLRASREDEHSWNFDAHSVREVADLLDRERREAHLYVGVAEAAQRAGVPQHRFAVLFGDRCHQRILTVTQQVQYLRADVEGLSDQGPVNPQVSLLETSAAPRG